MGSKSKSLFTFLGHCITGNFISIVGDSNCMHIHVMYERVSHCFTLVDHSIKLYM